MFAHNARYRCPGVEREAAGLVGGARPPRPRLPLPHRALRRRDATGQTWDGDLYLRGCGDPTLTSGDIARLARSIKARGIRTITGKVRGDESAYDTARAAPGLEAVLPRHRVAAALGARRRPRAGLARLSPPLLAARALRTPSKRTASPSSAGPGLGTRPRARCRSPSTSRRALATIAKAMNRESDNFTAEMLLKQLGTRDGGRGTSARGAQVVVGGDARGADPRRRACASSTARASRRLDRAHRRRARGRDPGRAENDHGSATRSSTPSRSQGGAGR